MTLQLYLMDDHKHFDVQRLARLIILFHALVEQFNPQSVEDFLLIAAAFERCSEDLLQEAVQMAQEKEANL